MAETSHRVSIKRKRSAQYGRQIARLTFGEDPRVFSIHADLLCANSTVFREHVQPRRRSIEGDCFICHTGVTLCHKELIYCDSCGSDYHYQYIEEWKLQTPVGEVTKCPLCRQEWLAQSDTYQYHFDKNSEDSLEMYSEWLYQGHIAFKNDVEYEDEGDGELYVLLCAHAFGHSIKDWKFCDTLLNAVVEVMIEQDFVPNLKFIRLVYRWTNTTRCIRHFLVGIFIHPRQTEWLEADASTKFPANFLRDMTVALLKKHPPDEYAWNEATMEAKFCVPGAHAEEHVQKRTAIQED
ncbi:hypothetical protein CC86DRAFT_466168 [Ophiobolus disseminans]|uniref:Uncharacterized protein n=1 Tax=Ophiobolus disseminans TaxID=1469910 RepID=A0A6A7A239_9PLEO|nr:hypothetical protein CC86DRAFT_466168 [Ophiobolus disseminans]